MQPERGFHTCTCACAGDGRKPWASFKQGVFVRHCCKKTYHVAYQGQPNLDVCTRGCGVGEGGGASSPTRPHGEPDAREPDASPTPRVAARAPGGRVTPHSIRLTRHSDSHTRDDTSLTGCHTPLTSSPEPVCSDAESFKTPVKHSQSHTEDKSGGLRPLRLPGSAGCNNLQLLYTQHAITKCPGAYRV